MYQKNTFHILEMENPLPIIINEIFKYELLILELYN